MGVRTDVPFKDLTAKEKDIVYHGPAVKKHIFYKAKSTNVAGELDFTYYNAIYTVENALAKVKDEKGMKKVERFLTQETCPKHLRCFSRKRQASYGSGPFLFDLGPGSCDLIKRREAADAAGSGCTEPNDGCPLYP